jgi:hypothetical protein
LWADKSIDQIIVTDSATPFPPLPNGIGSKLVVLSCAPLIADALQRLAAGSASAGGSSPAQG